jgi:hypothetical protein
MALWIEVFAQESTARNLEREKGDILSGLGAVTKKTASSLFIFASRLAWVPSGSEEIDLPFYREKLSCMRNGKKVRIKAARSEANYQSRKTRTFSGSSVLLVI